MRFSRSGIMKVCRNFRFFLKERAGVLFLVLEYFLSSFRKKGRNEFEEAWELWVPELSE